MFSFSRCGLSAHGTSIGCVPAFVGCLVVAVHLRTALATCQPFMLLFRRCRLQALIGARHWLRVSLSLRSSLFRFLLAGESESQGEVARAHGARAKRGTGGKGVGRKGKACS